MILRIINFSLLILLSDFAIAADNYRCHTLGYYELQESGLLKKIKANGSQFKTFTVNSKTGELKLINTDSGTLKIFNQGDSENSFLAIKPESSSSYGWQLKIGEYVDSKKKPFVISKIFLLGQIYTGWCGKY